MPGARHRHTVWPDRRDLDVIWVMGGEGHDVNGQQGYLDDVWRLRLPSGSAGAGVAWEWMGGAAVTAGHAPAQRGPTGRASMTVLNNAMDEDGRVGLFGGYRMLGSRSEVLNDLWQLDT